MARFVEQAREYVKGATDLVIHPEVWQLLYETIKNPKLDRTLMEFSVDAHELSKCKRAYDAHFIIAKWSQRLQQLETGAMRPTNRRLGNFPEALYFDVTTSKTDGSFAVQSYALLPSGGILSCSDGSTLYMDEYIKIGQYAFAKIESELSRYTRNKQPQTA